MSTAVEISFQGLFTNICAACLCVVSQNNHILKK